MSEDSSGFEGGGERAGGEDRISRLERDIEKLRSDVESAVENLRNAVVDIRSAVSEIENPFNLLRVITSEEDLNRIREGIRSKIQIQPKEEEGEKPEKPEEPAPEAKMLQKLAGKLDFRSSASFVKWIYMMLDLGFDEETIKSICEYCESFGLIPEGLSPTISRMVEAVIKAKSRGLLEEDIILSIYTAAESAGTKIEPSKIIDAVIQVLRRRKAERREKSGWDSQHQSTRP